MSHGTQKEKFQLAVRAGNHDEVAQYIPRGANPAQKHDISGFSVSALHAAALSSYWPYPDSGIAPGPWLERGGERGHGRRETLTPVSTTYYLF